MAAQTPGDLNDMPPNTRVKPAASMKICLSRRQAAAAYAQAVRRATMSMEGEPIAIWMVMPLLAICAAVLARRFSVLRYWALALFVAAAPLGVFFLVRGVSDVRQELGMSLGIVIGPVLAVFAFVASPWLRTRPTLAAMLSVPLYVAAAVVGFKRAGHNGYRSTVAAISGT